MNRTHKTNVCRCSQRDFIINHRYSKGVRLGKNIVTPSNTRSGTDMLLLNLKQGDSTLVQLQVYNITDNLMQRQRANLIV
ncbi:hypothetical protein D3C75_1327410 [compost metagenome]